MANVICFLLMLTFAIVSGSIIKRQACADKMQNCASYGANVCNTYKQWARENCQAFCKFCTGGSPTGNSGSCVDKLSNCADLGSDLCSSYAEFAQINCAHTCGLCATKPSSGGNCQDKLQNCASYGKSSCGGQYQQWAKENCKKFCGFCVTDNGGGFVGQTDVCVYKGQHYQEGQSWNDGCDKNCTCVSGQTGYYLCQSVCPRYKNLPAGCKMVKAPGQCCSKPQCPNQNVCAYKGGNYQEGQSWNDGCDYRCTCKNGKTGYYECTSRCVNWNLLPVCHLDQPAPGKCCPTPNCPPNVKINYPAGYVPE